MSDLRAITDAWVFVDSNLVNNDNLRTLYPDTERLAWSTRLNHMIPKILDLLEREIDQAVNGTSTNTVSMPTSSTTVSSGSGSMINLPTVTPTEREKLADDYTYEEFADLFESFQREGLTDSDVANSFRQWFKEMGGWDKTSPYDRTDVWGKAMRWQEYKRRTKDDPVAPERITRGQWQEAATRPRGRKQRNPMGPCPEPGCVASKRITTRRGDLRWRCDPHDYWGDRSDEE